MANNKQTAKPEEAYDPMKDLVTITLPRATGTEPREMFVSLNGKNYLLQRGSTVRLPRPVAEIVKRAGRYEEKNEKYKDALTAEMNRSAASAGMSV